MDKAALYNIGYGLYLLSAHVSGRDNGCIINTVLQITSGFPPAGVIAVNKQNHTHDMIAKSKKFNVSVLTEETPFEVFRHFGFRTGSEIDKFAGYEDTARSKNGVLYLTKNTSAYLSFEVTDLIDFGSHTMFRGNIVDGEVTGKAQGATYSYYQQHIKPKPRTAPKNAYRCIICNYVYEGEVLPEDFVCPLCKHGASDFTKIT